MSPKILEIVEVKNLSPEVANDLQKSFSPLFEKAKEWENKAKDIVVKDINDTEMMKKAREVRLELKKIRVDAEKVKTKYKEDILLKGRAIDGMFNIIKYLIVPIEKNLEDQEKFAELKEQQRLDELEQNRKDQYSKFIIDENAPVYDFRTMPEEVFQTLLSNAQTLFNIHKEKLAKEEAERVKKEKEAQEEQERIRKENEKLKAEAKKREEEAERERKAQEEKEKQEKEAHEKELEIERKAREKAEEEVRIAKEKQEAEAKKKQEEERKLSLAPDREKLSLLAKQLLDLSYPDLTSEGANKILGVVKEKLSEASSFIANNINNL